MKIKDIKTYHLRHKLDEPFGFSQWWYDQRNILLVEVILDSGISGWGEAYGPAEINKTIIETYYKHHLIGSDPNNIDELWKFMYNRSIDFGRKGVMVAALSAIDIALWDMKGKILKKPVYQLLKDSDDIVDSITPYATGMYFVRRDNLSRHLAEEAAGYVTEGFSAVKMKVGAGDIAQDVENVRAVREAIGDNTALMIDANHYFSVEEAIELGKQVEKYNIDWFEEPVSPDDYTGYRYLRENLDMPIAGGECEFTAIGFRDLLKNNSVDIAQPDPCAAGGISEMIKISQLVDEYPETRLVFHTWGSGVALTASLHLCAGLLKRKIFNNKLSYPIIEYDRTTNGFRENIFIDNPVLFLDGELSVPQGHGLGFEINREYINKYQVK